MIDPKNTSGPRGTYGCACVSRDASWCAKLRLGGDIDEQCECLCHQWRDDDKLLEPSADAYTRDHDDSDRWDG